MIFTALNPQLNVTSIRTEVSCSLIIKLSRIPKQTTPISSASSYNRLTWMISRSFLKIPKTNSTMKTFLKKVLEGLLSLSSIVISKKKKRKTTNELNLTSLSTILNNSNKYILFHILETYVINIYVSIRSSFPLQYLIAITLNRSKCSIATNTAFLITLYAATTDEIDCLIGWIVSVGLTFINEF